MMAKIKQTPERRGSQYGTGLRVSGNTSDQSHLWTEEEIKNMTPYQRRKLLRGGRGHRRRNV